MSALFLFVVPHVPDTVRRGLFTRQSDRSPRFEAAERAGHVGRANQAGRLRSGEDLRRAHGAHLGGKSSCCSTILIGD